MDGTGCGRSRPEPRPPLAKSACIGHGSQIGGDAEMKGLMQDYPLTVQHMLWRTGRLFNRKEIVTRREADLHRYRYTDLARRVSQLANVLTRLGVRAGDRVATLAWNNYRHLELYYAVPCAGAVLHTLNLRLFPDQLEFTIRDADDRVLFVDKTLIPVLDQVAGRIPSVRTIVVLNDGGPLPGHDLGEVLDYETLMAAETPDYSWPRLDEWSAAGMCYTSGTTGNPKGVVYSHRSQFLHAMCVLQKDSLGLSEHDTMLPVVPMFHANSWGIPYAAGLAGCKIRFADLATGAELPWDGEAFGEIQCRGPWIAAGYHNDADPGKITDDGWFRTGDVATMSPDGYITIVDRTKDVIKSGGEWISTVELEGAIMAHPKVLEAAVIGLQHSKWQERPVAYVVLRPEHRGQVTADEIRDFLSERVARWWLPDEIRFIDEMPKTSTLKFDKKVLRATAAPIAEETAAEARPS